MNDEMDGRIIKLPDSDPIPEILIVEVYSAPPRSSRSLNEEEEDAEEDVEEEDIHFSTIPDSTPNLEDDFMNSKPEKKMQPINKNSSAPKNRSSCCILI